MCVCVCVHTCMSTHIHIMMCVSPGLSRMSAPTHHYDSFEPLACGERIVDEKHNQAYATICVCVYEYVQYVYLWVCSVPPPCASVCILGMCVLSDVVSNVETCRRRSVERACRIIAATVTGRAASVRVPSVGKQCECVCSSVCQLHHFLLL